MDYIKWEKDTKEYRFPDDCVFPMPVDFCSFPLPQGLEGIVNGKMKETADRIREEMEMGLDSWSKCLSFQLVECLADPLAVKKVIFHNPATIVYWEDGTKTTVTCMDNVVDGRAKPAETYSKETGLALCYMKKALGNKGNYNNVFRQWITED